MVKSIEMDDQARQAESAAHILHRSQISANHSAWAIPERPDAGSGRDEQQLLSAVGSYCSWLDANRLRQQKLRFSRSREERSRERLISYGFEEERLRDDKPPGSRMQGFRASLPRPEMALSALSRP